jgi:hypothetical protein
MLRRRPRQIQLTDEREEVCLQKVGTAAEEQTVEVEGLPIRYLSAGEGSPLVLLHGAGDNALDWQWVLPDLAATHRVYAPDLPGSPDSARSSVDYSPAFFTRVVAGFFRCCGHRAGCVHRQLARRPHRPAVSTLRAGARNGLDPNRQRWPRTRSQPGVHVRQRSRPRRGSDAPMENTDWCLPESLGEGSVALRASSKGPARVVRGAAQAGALAGLLGGPPEGAARPSRLRGPTRGAS